MGVKLCTVTLPMSYQSNPLIMDATFSSMGPEVFKPSTRKDFYRNSYLTLKAQRTIFESMRPLLDSLNPITKDDSTAISHFKTIIPTILAATYDILFTYCPVAIEEIRLVLSPKVSEEINKFGTKLLLASLAMIRFENKLALQNINSDNENAELSDGLFPLDSPIHDPMTVMCQICENLVPISLIDQHSKNCALAYESSRSTLTTDERMKKLIQQTQRDSLKAAWPGQVEEAQRIFLPTVQVLSLLKSALQVDIGSVDAATTLSRVDTALALIEMGLEEQSVIILVENARRLLKQKLQDSENFARAADIAQRTRVGRRTSLPVHAVNIADFTFVKRISGGAYARVFLATKETLVEPIAVKVIAKRDLRQKNSSQRVLTERDIMMHFNSPYTIRFYYSTVGRHNLYMVMEYLPGGDLFSLLERLGAFTEDVARIYSAQIVAALAYLRANAIVHRDLKPDNILLDKNGRLKLVDFGLSLIGMVGRQSEATEEGCVGTPDYVAPEVILLQPHSYAVDYWSLGCMLFEFMVGIPPFHGDTPQETFANVLKCSIDFQLLDESGASSECVDIIKRLLTTDPRRRLGAKGVDEIKTHPWFKDIDFDNLEKIPAPYHPPVANRFDTSNFEMRGCLSREVDADIIEDLEVGTQMTRVADDFDGQFVAKSTEGLRTISKEQAMILSQSESSEQLVVPEKKKTPTRRKVNRTYSLRFKSSTDGPFPGAPTDL